MPETALNRPTVLAIIPARSGSKGLKDKNISPYLGKPLLAHSVELAVSAPEITETLISTDSAQYETIAKEYGAHSLGLRPAHLSTDSAKSADVVLNIIQILEEQGTYYDYILLLQPTTPQRTPDEVPQILDIALEHKAKAVVSVSAIEEPHPYKLKSIDEQGRLEPFIKGASSEIPRQQLPPAYKLTGAYYLVETEAFKQHQSFFIPNETYPFVTPAVMNIDTPEDYEFLCWKAQRAS